MRGTYFSTVGIVVVVYFGGEIGRVSESRSGNIGIYKSEVQVKHQNPYFLLKSTIIRKEKVLSVLSLGTDR